MNIARYANAAEIGQVVGRAPGRYKVIRQNSSTLALVYNSTSLPDNFK